MDAGDQRIQVQPREGFVRLNHGGADHPGGMVDAPLRTPELQRADQTLMKSAERVFDLQGDVFRRRRKEKRTKAVKYRENGQNKPDNPHHGHLDRRREIEGGFNEKQNESASQRAAERQSRTVQDAGGNLSFPKRVQPAQQVPVRGICGCSGHR